MKQTTATKHNNFFKTESAQESRRKEAAKLCGCGTPEVWCVGIDCFPYFEMDPGEAREQAEFAAALEVARDFGY
jgi:hypothetical protein